MDEFANKRLLQVRTSNRMKYWEVKKNATVFKEHYAFTRIQAPVGFFFDRLFDVHFSAVHLVLLLELGYLSHIHTHNIKFQNVLKPSECRRHSTTMEVFPSFN